MPAEGIDYLDRKDLLSYEEIVLLSEVFYELGVRKIRITGGEPFVRKDIGILLQSLSDIFPSVHITTNATLLQNHINSIKSLGIANFNISIDSLDANRFWMITRRDSYDTVMHNIKTCIDQGISIKLNVVTMQGVNDMEIVDFVRFGMKHKVPVRFIEAMPFNADDGNTAVFMSAADIAQRIAASFPSLTRINSDQPSSSIAYQIGDYQLGIIPAFTRSLCSSCNRIRLTPKGEMLNCLYSAKGLDLKSLLRSGASKRELAEAMTYHVSQKRKTGQIEEAERSETIFNSMTTIGG